MTRATRSGPRRSIGSLWNRDAGIGIRVGSARTGSLAPTRMQERERTRRERTAPTSTRSNRRHEAGSTSAGSFSTQRATPELPRMTTARTAHFKLSVEPLVGGGLLECSNQLRGHWGAFETSNWENRNERTQRHRISRPPRSGRARRRRRRAQSERADRRGRREPARPPSWFRGSSPCSLATTPATPCPSTESRWSPSRVAPRANCGSEFANDFFKCCRSPRQRRRPSSAGHSPASIQRTSGRSIASPTVSFVCARPRRT